MARSSDDTHRFDPATEVRAIRSVTIALSSADTGAQGRKKSSPSHESMVCTIAISASRRDSSHSRLMQPQRSVPHHSHISWSKPAHLIRLAAVTDFDRSCFRVLPAEGFLLSRLLKFPFKSNFQQGQGSSGSVPRVRIGSLAANESLSP